jgi:hypothetical protein
LYETGAPPAPPPLPDHHEVVAVEVPPARPARGFDATTAILPGPPPGTTTHRLRGVETSQQ